MRSWCGQGPWQEGTAVRVNSRRRSPKCVVNNKFWIGGSLALFTPQSKATSTQDAPAQITKQIH